MKTLLILALLFAVLLTLSVAPSMLAECPSRAYGTNNQTTIKYFSSPFCIACWHQKTELQRIAAENGDKFLVEEYDADLCASAAYPQRVMGVPAFIKNNNISYGFKNKEQLQQLIT
ncbi:hypothetical protein HY489_02725 [Candidatus Woesearchaeota archaeon]|nr:hypothetical protein [Candidatus Woesearchaeota archaeon]